MCQTVQEEEGSERVLQVLLQAPPFGAPEKETVAQQGRERCEMEKLMDALVPCCCILAALLLAWWLLRLGGAEQVSYEVKQLRKKLNDWDRRCRHNADLHQRYPEVEFRRQH